MSASIHRLSPAGHAVPAQAAGHVGPDVDAEPVALGFADDETLARALQSGHPGAPAALFDRFAPRLERILAHVLGLDAEIPDLLHEVFARALSGIHKLEDPTLLAGWLARIAVFTARGCIRARQRRRWLTFWAPDELPEVDAPSASPEDRQAVRALYRVLSRLATRERIAFALRFIEGMTLAEGADACDVSQATFKRRVAAAHAAFAALAAQEPELAVWLSAHGGPPRQRSGASRDVTMRPGAGPEQEPQGRASGERAGERAGAAEHGERGRGGS